MDDAGGAMATSSKCPLACVCSAVAGLMNQRRSESTALTVGAEGKRFQDQAWQEILEVLVAQAGEVEEIVDERKT